MRIMKNHFRHRVGKYDPISELARDFCGGIGPLQLDVVLVFQLSIIIVVNKLPRIIGSIMPGIFFIS